ncbi:hypothetical protein SeMB42_g01379 [Synchytrium endobioticum]|uniref:C2H2-type domain-containing protein n=1 Tax=Synchytrium endobioticum TaxID=286115 RepID=A0A507DLF9_9FUNG|nr:hypothetical protein SeMB42_g01379 [Synchytrium endobioticum]
MSLLRIWATPPAIFATSRDTKFGQRSGIICTNRNPPPPKMTTIPTPPRSEFATLSNAIDVPNPTPSRSGTSTSYMDTGIEVSSTVGVAPSITPATLVIINEDSIKIPVPRYGISALQCDTSLLDFFYHSQIYGKDEPNKLLSWKEHRVNCASLELVLSEPHLLKNRRELKKRALATAAPYISGYNNESAEFASACFPRNPPFEIMVLLGISCGSELQSKIASECTWEASEPLAHVVDSNGHGGNVNGVNADDRTKHRRPSIPVEQRASPSVSHRNNVYSSTLERSRLSHPLLPPSSQPHVHSYDPFLNGSTQSSTSYNGVPPSNIPQPLHHQLNYLNRHVYNARVSAKQQATAPTTSLPHQRSAQNGVAGPSSPDAQTLLPPGHTERVASAIQQAPPVAAASPLSRPARPPAIQMHQYQPYPVVPPSPTDKNRNVISTPRTRRGSASTKDATSPSSTQDDHSNSNDSDESSNDGGDTKRKHVCTVPGCGKTFTRKYNLMSHQRAHSNDRPFQCHHCASSFSRTHDLRRHIRSLHTGQRPHTCPHCPLAFARSDALKRHLKLVVEKGGAVPDTHSSENVSNLSLRRAELERMVLNAGSNTDERVDSDNSSPIKASKEEEEDAIGGAPPRVANRDMHKDQYDKSSVKEEDEES